MVLREIGLIRTPFPEKFGVPRQGQGVSDIRGQIHIASPFGRREAWEGIEGFSHLWLITNMHQIPSTHRKLSVRPPRLGGNEKRGVFATRSPFRPNPLGLTAVRLIDIEFLSRGRAALTVEGIDLVDGTPVLDIKPYISTYDSIVAKGGWTEKIKAKAAKQVVWDASVSIPSKHFQQLAETVLAEQTIPSTSSSGQFGMALQEWNIRWEERAQSRYIVSIELRGEK